MNKVVYTLQLTTLCILSVMSIDLSFAGAKDIDDFTIKPGVYIGLGSSVNSLSSVANITVDEQQSTVTIDNTDPAPSRTAATSQSYQYTDNEQKINLSPKVNLGYWRPLNQLWLWGVETNYSFLNLKTDSFMYQVNPDNVTQVDTLNMKHEFNLVAYLGHQYKTGFFFAGLGPALFIANLDSSIPNANYNLVAILPEHMEENKVKKDQYGSHTNNSRKIKGGVGKLGVIYYLTPSWFVNLNYTYTFVSARVIANNLSSLSTSFTDDLYKGETINATTVIVFMATYKQLVFQSIKFFNLIGAKSRHFVNFAFYDQWRDLTPVTFICNNIL